MLKDPIERNGVGKGEKMSVDLIAVTHVLSYTFMHALIMPHHE